MRKLCTCVVSLLMGIALVKPMPIFAEESAVNTYGTTYYVDSNIGKNDGDGLSVENAFDSLTDINEKTFQPGDKILFKAGSTFTGTLWPKGSGSAGYPIIVDMYGTGDKPIIDGNGAYFMPQIKDWQGPFTGQDGDQIGAAVYLYNQEYIEINNLNIKNTGDNVNRDRSGIRVEGYNYGKINHIYIRNCDIHDVRGYNGQDDIYPVIPTNPDGSPLDGYIGGDQSNPNTSNTFWGARTTHRTGGINLVTYTARKPEAKNTFNVMVQELDTTKKITTFNDVLIENNTITNCQANGITTTNVKGTLDDVDFRHTNVIIRNNYIHNVTRAGIIPLYTSKVLVEHNKVDTFQSTYEGYGCGIWCDRADGMIFQYNEVCNGQNGQDGMAFNLDDMTRDGIIQYNYTHDNYGGGYMLHVRQKSYNRNNTIRYNLSINDSGVFANHNAQIVAVGETDVTKLESAKVYQNTFISNKDCHAVFEGDEVDYTNNIWYFTNATVATRNQCFQPGVNSTFNNNVYIGCIAPTDENGHFDDPMFVGGNQLFGLQKQQAFANASLKTSSPYIDAGVEISNHGGFDILGRPVQDTTNIGAFGGAGHDVKVIPVAMTIKANQVLRYLNDGTLQTDIIDDLVQEADTKWVDTTFNGEPVIYTKKLDNYIEFSFHGTGGILKLKRGGGAGNVQMNVYLKDNLTTPVKSLNVNTYNASQDEIIINDLQNLSSDNKEYVVRMYNKESGKAANFMAFTSEVNVDETVEPGCTNDQLTGIVIEQPMLVTIPYAKDSASIRLQAHTFMDTCNPHDISIPITYSVNNNGEIAGNLLTLKQAGVYTITATATYNGKMVNATTTVKVEMGSEPQVNVPAVNTKALENLIVVCDSIDFNNYAPDNRNTFDTKLQEAKDVLQNEKVTQDEIDRMIDALKAAKDALIQIRFDAEDRTITRTGNWVDISESTLDKGSALKSGAADEKLSFVFNGSGIRVYGRKAVGTGTVRFVITNTNTQVEVTNIMVDCYSETKLDKELLFEWLGDENGLYRIDIINTGIKNASATNRDTNAIIDYITIERQEEVILDKDTLETLINQCDQIILDKYMDDTNKQTFITTLAKAKEVVNTATSQAQIDAMILELTATKDALRIKTMITVNATNLAIQQTGNFVVNNGSLITKEQGAKLSYTFTGEGIEVFAGKLVDTGHMKVTVLAITDEQEDVVKTEIIDTKNTSKARLQDTFCVFSYYGTYGEYRIECENLDQAKMIVNSFTIIGNIVSKDALQDKVTSIENEHLDASKFTRDSYQALENALQYAREVINNSLNQAEIDRALASLMEARSALVALHQVCFELTNENIKTFMIPDTMTFKDSIKDTWPTANKTGYTFNGWVIKGTNTAFNQESSVQSDITVVPIFTANQYTLTYHDGKQVTTEYFTIEDSILLKIPTKQGYQFKGWYKEADFSGNAIERIEHTSENIDVYAKWQEAKIENPIDSGKTNTIQTGDNNHFDKYGMILCIAGLGYVLVRKKKEDII